MDCVEIMNTTMLLGAPPVGQRRFPKAVCDATERTPSLVDRLSTLKELPDPRGPRASGGERLARSRATVESRIGSFQDREIRFEGEPRVQKMAMWSNAVDRQLAWEMSVSLRILLT